MKKKVLILGSLAILSVAYVLFGQSAGNTPRPASAPTTAPAQAAPVGAAQRKMLDQYCVGCHNEDDRVANLMIDKLDPAHVAQDAQTWEKVVRKMRAGMMPPSGNPRPDRAATMALVGWLENELDKSAVAYMPPPGLHRLNRTEYGNVIHDLLDLEIDPGKYLPTDDSTRGFDNIAGALGLSSTLVESYVSAAGKISRLAMGDATTPSLVVYRAPEDTSQDYHVLGMPLGTRGGLLVKHVFPSDGEYTITVTPIFGDNMSPQGFGTVPCEKIEFLLDNERLQIMDWQGGGRGGGGAANCGGGAGAAAGGGNRGGGANAGQRGGNAGQRGGNGGNGGAQAAGAVGGAAAGAESAQPAAGAAAQAGAAAANGGGANAAGGNGGGGGRGGTPMQIRFAAKAGQHSVAVTFLQTNFAPILDIDIHPLRDTVQTGPTPGYTFFPHVGTVRIEGPYNAVDAQDSASRRKIFICRPSGAADEAACARKIITNLATQAFRRPATSDDLSSLMDFYQSGRQESDFDHGIETALSRILASPKFIYRMEVEPANVKPGQPYRISDIELASRLSFFLWSTRPDATLIDLASKGMLKDPVVLEAQVRRMLKDPRSEALSINFAGQWLNLRGMQAVGPLPLLYPNFDDPLRQAERREVELLFNSIVTEDRNVVDLLTANDTYVNERLARHYGISGIYGSQFRKIMLPPELDVRRGLLGKAAILTTTAKPERTSPVTRGKWIMTNIIGVGPPDPPPDVPPLKATANDARGNAKTPTMRQKMEDHRAQIGSPANAACVQCHKMMDPIGFSLENFDAIAVWRTEDEGTPITKSEVVYDGTTVNGPSGLRNWIVDNYSSQFVEVTAEKLLTYALGRGVEYQDMPLVRSVARDAGRNNNRFSALVLAVVKSKPFQMNMKVQETAIPASTTKKEGN
jgi:hypothetical protein